jgi:50S ribosomal subunit-associated GTPase HflX
LCEYYDNEKGRILNRNYILFLQDKVRALTDELEKVAAKDLSASKETENQDVEKVNLVPSTAAGKASLFVSTSERLQLTKE